MTVFNQSELSHIVVLAIIIGVHYEAPIKLTWATITRPNQITIITSNSSIHHGKQEGSNFGQYWTWQRGERMVEMWAANDDLHRQNQTLKDNVIHIQQRQHEINPPEDVEISDPHPLSDKIWEFRCWRISNHIRWLS